MVRWLFAIALVGCQARTELIVGIATDLHATDQLHHVELQVLIDGTPLGGVGSTWELGGPGSPGENLPASYGVYSDGDETQIELLLTAYQDGKDDPIVTRDAIVSLVGGETLFYRMGLTASCEAVGCPDGQSCVEGACRDVGLDSHGFPAFDGSLVTTLTCTSGTAYIDTATGSAMASSPDATACPKSLCQEGTCLVPPDTQSISIDDLGAAYAKALCEQQFACCTAAQIATSAEDDYTDEPSCETYVTGEIGRAIAVLESYVASGATVYHGDLAGACVAAVGRESCGAADGDESSCDGVFQGTLPGGAACESSLQCAQGDCGFDTGTCGELATVGHSCSDHECATGLYCSSTDETCQVGATSGQACTTSAPCLGGLYCDAGTSTCLATKPAGAACTTDDECISFDCSSTDGTPGTCIGGDDADVCTSTL